MDRQLASSKPERMCVHGADAALCVRSDAGQLPELAMRSEAAVTGVGEVIRMNEEGLEEEAEEGEPPRPSSRNSGQDSSELVSLSSHSRSSSSTPTSEFFAPLHLAVISWLPPL
jgi:hypothetical protein